MERKDLIVEWRSTGNGMDYLLWLEYKLMNEKPRSDVQLEQYKKALEDIANQSIAKPFYEMSNEAFYHMLLQDLISIARIALQNY